MDGGTRRNGLDTGGAQSPGSAPKSCGILELLRPGGPDHLLDSASAYYATSGQLLRALTRQLFAYPASRDLSNPAFAPAPDLAEVLPTAENGGISTDHRTVTGEFFLEMAWGGAERCAEIVLESAAG